MARREGAVRRADRPRSRLALGDQGVGEAVVVGDAIARTRRGEAIRRRVAARVRGAAGREDIRHSGGSSSDGYLPILMRASEGTSSDGYLPILLMRASEGTSSPFTTNSMYEPGGATFGFGGNFTVSFPAVRLTISNPT
jgi:hypothetical protein